MIVAKRQNVRLFSCACIMAKTSYIRRGDDDDDDDDDDVRFVLDQIG